MSEYHASHFSSYSQNPYSRETFDSYYYDNYSHDFDDSYYDNIFRRMNFDGPFPVSRYSGESFSHDFGGYPYGYKQTMPYEDYYPQSHSHYAPYEYYNRRLRSSEIIERPPETLVKAQSEFFDMNGMKPIKEIATPINKLAMVKPMHEMIQVKEIAMPVQELVKPLELELKVEAVMSSISTDSESKEIEDDRTESPPYKKRRMVTGEHKAMRKIKKKST